MPNKDLVIGMDVYTQNHRFQILSHEIKFKREFKPYSTIPKLFILADTPMRYEDIKGKLLNMSADSHDLFKGFLFWKKGFLYRIVGWIVLRLII